MMKKGFFKDMDWEKIRNKEIDSESIPYKPNPNKYKYLLDNQYEDVSSLLKLQPCTATSLVGQTPDEPESASPKPKRLLGDFTMYKVNKEFDNF
jgi:hypothetical protein